MTPRSGTLALEPVSFLLMSTMTNSSGEARTRSPSRRTPGALITIWACSLVSPLFISAVEPLRRTIAVSSDPAATMVRSNPLAIESTAAKTSTTAATPMTATTEPATRFGRLRMLRWVTANS